MPGRGESLGIPLDEKVHGFGYCPPDIIQLLEYWLGSLSDSGSYPATLFESFESHFAHDRARHEHCSTNAMASVLPVGKDKG